MKYQKKYSVSRVYPHIRIVLIINFLCLSLLASKIENSCRSFYFSKRDLVALSAQQQNIAKEYLESHFEKQVSNVYEKNWNRFIFFYTSFFREIYAANGVELYSMKKLGFIFSEDASVRAPSLKAFITKYEALLNEFKIPEKKRIRPAIVLQNYLSKEYLTVRIGIDPWPTDFQKWTFMNGVRFKSRDMAKAISAGRFPLFLDGLHDVFHLLSFALHPEYVSYLKKGNTLLIENMASGLMARAAFNLELLSLADPNKHDALAQVLSIKNPAADSRIENFETAINRLSNEETIEKSKFWIKNLQSYLIHYAAGMRDPQEREVLRSYIDSSSEFLVNSKTMPKEVVASALAFFDVRLDTQLKTELNSEVFLKTDSTRLTELRKLLVQLEYALWTSSKQIDLDQWMKDTMIAEVDKNSPTFKFLADVFGESSIIYRHLIRH